MNEVAVWRSEGESKVAQQQIQRIAQKAADDIAQGQRRAAEKAANILRECKTARFPYLEAKGFPEEVANVWKSDKGEFMVVPMRVGRDIVGCQLIDAEGVKKFLYGQRCSLAQHVFTAGNGGVHIVCEGYATALSVRVAMARLKRPYALHVCFSAGNMKKVASALPMGLAIADNDASGTGERIAKEIGWPYWMSDVVGEDFNDAHRRLGLFQLSQGLTRKLLEVARCK